MNFLRLDYSKCSGKSSAVHKAISEGQFNRNRKDLKRTWMQNSVDFTLPPELLRQHYCTVCIPATQGLILQHF